MNNLRITLNNTMMVLIDGTLGYLLGGAMDGPEILKRSGLTISAAEELFDAMRMADRMDFNPVDSPVITKQSVNLSEMPTNSPGWILVVQKGKLFLEVTPSFVKVLYRVLEQGLREMGTELSTLIPVSAEEADECMAQLRTIIPKQ